jgi:hypothetical protein
MQYLLLIYDDERNWMDRPKAQLDEMYKAYGAFSESVQRSGHMKGGAELQPVRSATTVRVRDGKTLKTDGPFAETREQLGGYYLIEAKDLDEALGIAARIPSAKSGSIEVRPLVPPKQTAG